MPLRERREAEPLERSARALRPGRERDLVEAPSRRRGSGRDPAAGMPRDRSGRRARRPARAVPPRPWRASSCRPRSGRRARRPRRVRRRATPRPEPAARPRYANETLSRRTTSSPAEVTLRHMDSGWLDPRRREAVHDAAVAQEHDAVRERERELRALLGDDDRAAVCRARARRAPRRRRDRAATAARRAAAAPARARAPTRGRCAGARRRRARSRSAPQGARSRPQRVPRAPGARSRPAPCRAFSSPKLTSARTRVSTTWSSGSWNSVATVPTRSAGGVVRVSRPPTTTRPAKRPPWKCGTSPDSARSSVDLPEPEAPSSATNSPGATRSDTPLERRPGRVRIRERHVLDER